MKSLANPADRAELSARLARVRADTPRQWGRMTAPQMVCHLSDVFLALMAERPVTSPTLVVPWLRRRLLKLFALQLPLPWPHGVKTRPEVDAEQGGTPPGDFSADVAALERACDRFIQKGPARLEHYLFGPLTRAEWARWGYRHMDHHLRQFGV